MLPILFKENRKWFLQKDKQKWKGCIEVTERELIKLYDQIGQEVLQIPPWVDESDELIKLMKKK